MGKLTENLGPMKPYESIFYGDFKYYCKTIKRDIFNKVIDESHSHAFPDGKLRKRRYENNLEAIFAKFKKHIIRNLYMKDIETPMTKHITDKHGKLVRVQPNVTFDEIIRMILKSQMLSLHFHRILECYKSARECIEFEQRSHHDDLAVKCNYRHYYYLKRVFDRFSLNRRCLEPDDSFDKPKMIIIMNDGDKK